MCVIAGLSGTFGQADESSRGEGSRNRPGLPVGIRKLGDSNQCVHQRYVGDRFAQFFFQGDAAAFHRSMHKAGSVCRTGSLRMHVNPKTVPRLPIPGKAEGSSYDWMVTF